MIAVRGTTLLMEGQKYEILRYENGEPVVAVSCGGETHEMTYAEDWFRLAPPPTKFNVGDRVVSSENGHTKYRVEAIDGESVSVRVVERSGATGHLFEGQRLDIFSLDLGFATPVTTPISLGAI